MTFKWTGISLSSAVIVLYWPVVWKCNFGLAWWMLWDRRHLSIHKQIHPSTHFQYLLYPALTVLGRSVGAPGHGHRRDRLLDRRWTAGCPAEHRWSQWTWVTAHYLYHLHEPFCWDTTLCRSKNIDWCYFQKMSHTKKTIWTWERHQTWQKVNCWKSSRAQRKSVTVSQSSCCCLLLCLPVRFVLTVPWLLKCSHLTMLVVAMCFRGRFRWTSTVSRFGMVGCVVWVGIL